MILLLTSVLDYSADLVVRQLMKSGAHYVRLNVEDYRLGTECTFSPEMVSTLEVAHAGATAIQVRDIQSVYFRCGTSVANFRPSDTEPLANLAATQWNAFVRGLESLPAMQWMNRPSATYRAEQKICQLQEAHRLGFDVPPTIVTNDARKAVDAAKEWACDVVVVKPLDTVLLCEGSLELFAFSEFVRLGDLAEIDIRSAPVIVQRAIHPKIDLRVTVVRNEVFCVRITDEGRGVDGDWRHRHASASFTPYELSATLAGKCRALVRSFGLSFGALDFADDGHRTWFLELNPTGEWGWLVAKAGQEIDVAIVRALTGPALPGSGP